MRGQSVGILVVEDDVATAAAMVRGLKGAGFSVELANDASSGVARALQSDTRLILLDLDLRSGGGGIPILRLLHDRFPHPIIALSARGELEHRLLSFESGASDYLTKPFWVEELVARVRAHLRHHEPAPWRQIRWANAVLNLDSRSLVVEGRPRTLTRTEFNVLAFLAERPRRVISREELAKRALGTSGERQRRTVDSHVARIRKHLGPRAARHLVTVWGVGYRFEEEKPDRPTHPEARRSEREPPTPPSPS